MNTKLNFAGIDDKLLWGINEVKDQLGIELCDNSILVEVIQSGLEDIYVKMAIKTSTR